MENLILRMLPLLRALAGPATLLLPWVRFENEAQYDNALEAIVYVLPFSPGWMPIIQQNTFPFGWAVLALLVVIMLLTLKYLFKAIAGRPTLWTGAVTMVAGTLWLLAALPHCDAVSLAILGFYAVYGSEPAGYLISRRAAGQRTAPAR